MATSPGCGCRDESRNEHSLTASPSATIDVIGDIRAATKLPLIVDGGIEGGLDMLRAIALGADFVMMGRAWHYALAALGEKGPEHLIQLLQADLTANMGQLGAKHLTDVRKQTRITG